MWVGGVADSQTRSKPLKRGWVRGGIALIFFGKSVFEKHPTPHIAH